MRTILSLLTILVLNFGVSHAKDNPALPNKASGGRPYGQPENSLYYTLGQPEKSLAYYLKYAETGDYVSAIDAAIILQELGRPNEAVSLLEKSVAKHPGEPRAISALAWAYLCSGNTARSLETFAKISGAESGAPRNAIGIALAQFQQKKYSDSASGFQKLAKNRNLSALAYYFLGKIAEESGVPGKAVELYAKALKEDSHFVEARPAMARIYEAQKQVDDAWAQYAKIAMMDSSHKLAAEKKETLLAKLIKKPEEILKTKKIREFTAISPAPYREESPEIRIGIGSSPGGNPVHRGKLSFRVSGPFTILDLKRSKEVGTGKANETWIVTIGTGPRSGQAFIESPSGSYIFSGAVLIKPMNRGKATIILESVPYAPGMAWSGIADKELRGELEIAFNAAQKGFSVVNRLPLEEYLYGVIAAEMPVHWPTEALKAQAVIARTYAMHIKTHLRPHAAQGYDLCDEQHCQVYSGVAVENAKTRSVADLTRGQALAYNGKAIHAVFSSNCGGHTQSGTGAGWSDLPYWLAVYDGNEQRAVVWRPGKLADFLQTSPEVYCKASKYTWSPEFRWTRYIAAEDIIARLARKAAVGKLKQIVFIRGESGRVATVKFVGTANTVTITKEHEIRRVFGIAPLRSNLFRADVFYDAGFVKSLFISGGGWGHGVGLCQSGAAGRAEKGMTYDRILPAYYPGTALKELKDVK